jgi:hypothetical protein
MRVALGQNCLPTRGIGAVSSTRITLPANSIYLDTRVSQISAADGSHTCSSARSKRVPDCCCARRYRCGVRKHLGLQVGNDCRMGFEAAWQLLCVLLAVRREEAGWVGPILF